MNNLESFALRWLQKQLGEILPTAAPVEQAFPTKLPLSELPGQPGMRFLYAELRRRGVKLPPLFLTWTQLLLIGLLPCGIVIAGALGIITQRGLLEWSDFGGVVVLSLACWAVLAILAKLFLASVSSADTVGELAQQLFWENAPFFSRLAGIRLSHEQIQQIVIQVLADATGVDRDEITEKTRLVEIMD